MKKWHYLIALLFCCNIVVAKTKCDSQVNYDIYITANNIKIIGNNKTYTITPEGEISVNQQPQTISPATKLKAQRLQSFIRQTVPEIEKKTYWHLEDLRHHFNSAIVKNVGQDSSLIKHLDNIYNKLKALMRNAIKTQNGTTEFHHANFNRITDDGEKAVKGEFVGVLKDSVLEFKLFKNFSTLKGIAKNEWKKKKDDLKKFNAEVCDDMANINKAGFPFGL